MIFRKLSPVFLTSPLAAPQATTLFQPPSVCIIFEHVFQNDTRKTLHIFFGKDSQSWGSAGAYMPKWTPNS